MRILLFAVILLSAAIAHLPGARLLAQDKPALKPGEIVTGELTNAAPEAQFTFSGKKDDYYIVTFQGYGKDRILADLSVQDSKGASVASGFADDGVLLKLPADGDYNVVVKRRASGEGPFALQLYPVNTLQIGQHAEAEITYRLLLDEGRFVGTDAYFMVVSEKDVSVTITLGERQYPQHITGFLSYNISQPRATDKSRQETVFSGSGHRFAGLSIMVPGTREYYLVSLAFNGYASTKKLKKDDLLTQRFTVAAEVK
jgi:hypothetical protein